MDFDEDRLNYAGLNIEYLEEDFHRKIKKTLGYIIANYDGQVFIERCYEIINGRKPSQLELKALEKLAKQGLPKEGICYKLLKESGKISMISEQTEKLYKKKYDQMEWDVSDVLCQDGPLFVKECYRQILERDPDETGFINFCMLIRNGTPKEVVVYMLAASDEARKIKKIKSLEHYKTVYDVYANKPQEEHRERKIEKLKKPIWNYAVTKEIEQKLYEMSLKDDYRNEQLSQSLHNIIRQNDSLIERMKLLENELVKLRDKEG